MSTPWQILRTIKITTSEEKQSPPNYSYNYTGEQVELATL